VPRYVRVSKGSRVDAVEPLIRELVALQHEREAYASAVELLTPAEIITPQLPRRVDFHTLG
jgi:hypothetical protein